MVQNQDNKYVVEILDHQEGIVRIASYEGCVIVSASFLLQILQELRPIFKISTKGLQMEEHILQFFEYSHLPNALQEVSKPFCDLANNHIMALQRNPERTVALRKLLEAKDAAVRAFIAK